ncbi:saccharopine dehydrogenase [Streptacidiphilus sp. PB12-B1b]|uniref:saccharopine dehydrogenase family protein n=1 Tax=Streptacidiphilus sp. PB12-B1b TaxID=2705012 RepID=UPI0015FD2514|nr:saccharopine dehydrogenase family protein [Streptacidiphilus sp. PB12-B1b]QMU78292.1 saccharopine dehydrogenase [Streptacidiphilus sp. PB12-B1b]
MSDTQYGALAASGTVHWVGAGLSTGSGLTGLCRAADQVLLWHRTEERAAESLARLGLSTAATPRAYTREALADDVKEGDVVVSMLPATEHAALLRDCIDRRTHFACSSYASEELSALAQEARPAGVVVLTEAGLDPGIDHLFAHSLLARATAAVDPRKAAEVVFTSYCGGVPATPDAFTYRFSWAPTGVLNALRAPARYVEDGVARTAVHPWEAVKPQLLGDETFEVYPNRDSVPFIAQYQLPEAWTARTFVRGTLRLSGWSRAWEPVFETVRSGDDERIRALALELAAKYPMGAGERDRVVLAVSLDVDAGSAGRWSGRYLLDQQGDQEESAMARCVSKPLALGVRELLAGRLPAGLNRAVGNVDQAEDWLRQLRDEGIGYTLRTD